MSKLKKFLTKFEKIAFRNLGEFFANPDIDAICQSNPLLAGISTYFGGHYTQEQYETLLTFIHFLHAKLLKIETNKIDINFFNSQTGKRIIGKILRGISRDNRNEKIETMSNLTVNLFIKSKLIFNSSKMESSLRHSTSEILITSILLFFSSLVDLFLFLYI